MTDLETKFRHWDKPDMVTVAIRGNELIAVTIFKDDKYTVMSTGNNPWNADEETFHPTGFDYGKQS